MRKWGAASVCPWILVLSAQWAVALPTADQLLGEIARVAKELKTYSCDVQMTVMTFGGRMVGTGSLVGMNELKDGKAVRKSYSTMKWVPTIEWVATGEDRKKEKMTEVIVRDGTYYWAQANGPEPGVVRVEKNLQNSLDETGIPRGLDSLTEFDAVWKEMYTLRVTGEDTIGNDGVYVMEGTFNDAYLKKNPKYEHLMVFVVHVKFFVGQKTMYPYRTIWYDEEGHETNREDATSVKLNEKVDEKLFNYVPPKGAEVIDRTKAKE